MLTVQDVEAFNGFQGFKSHHSKKECFTCKRLMWNPHLVTQTWQVEKKQLLGGPAGDGVDEMLRELCGTDKVCI